jgi:hypothetical protein
LRLVLHPHYVSCPSQRGGLSANAYLRFREEVDHSRETLLLEARHVADQFVKSVDRAGKVLPHNASLVSCKQMVQRRC